MIDLHVSRHRPTVAVVDLAALSDNFHTLYRLAQSAAQNSPEFFFCPMVKANAYGHGDLQVVSRLRGLGAAWVGVGLIEEALHLRAAGDTGNILNFGPFDREGARALLAEEVTPVVSSRADLQHLIDSIPTLTEPPESVDFHLKVETGMNRLGVEFDELDEVLSTLTRSPQLKLRGLMTHFANGEDAADPQGRTEMQMREFSRCHQKLVAGVSAEVRDHLRLHVGNSGALLAYAQRPRALAVGFRPGLALYGGGPLQSGESALRPVLSLKSRIAQLREIAPGERVSYGGTWTALRRSRLGVVPCGYADGVRRGMSGKMSVLVRGRRVPVAGVICMDYFMCDLTEVQDAQVGDEVTLLGTQGQEEIRAESWARELGSISYEVLTGISERVPRLYVDASIGNN
ncbi:MAG TPA: alanine racemase [Pseudobdellovibrionaceae bacterium]|nr:alanine racemase [Pseudobdellovibrionaceae bacterium]